MRVRPFSEADSPAWERLCAASHAASFLQTRRFLSYHGDRFIDRSLLIEDDAGRLLGLLPAAQHPQRADTVESHPGITYGGLVHDGALRGERCIEALSAACEHYAAMGYRTLRYKPLPHIYQRAPAQDDLYALFRLDARRVRAELSACIDLTNRLPTSERRRRAIAKANRNGLAYAIGVQYAPALWSLIEDNLASRHSAKPVHSLTEIVLLAERFPEQIAFHVALHEGRVVAGIVTFGVGPVLHCQYIAAGEAGHALAALDGLTEHLIAVASAAGLRHFDFGTSNEDQGRVLNDGLYRFKAEFGSGGVVHETYEIGLA